MKNHIILFVLCGLSLSACVTRSAPVPSAVNVQIERDAESSQARGPFVLVLDEPLGQPRHQCDYDKYKEKWFSRNKGKASSETFATSEEYKNYQDCVSAADEAHDLAHLQQIGVVLLRGSLAAQPSLRVGSALSQQSKADYIIQIRITELVPDIKAKERSADAPTLITGLGISQVLPYVQPSAAGVLGPVSAVVSHFDIITGIPTTWDKETKQGFVACEIQAIHARSGKVLHSFRAAAVFNAERKSVGRRLSGYRKVSVETTSPIDALQVALAEAAVKLAEVLSR